MYDRIRYYSLSYINRIYMIVHVFLEWGFYGMTKMRSMNPSVPSSDICRLFSHIARVFFKVSFIRTDRSVSLSGAAAALALRCCSGFCGFFLSQCNQFEYIFSALLLRFILRSSALVQSSSISSFLVFCRCFCSTCEC